MIDLFSSDTPNGKKISIMLEEIGFEYTVKKMDLSKAESVADLISSKFNLTSISLNNPFLFISTDFDDLSK